MATPILTRNTDSLPIIIANTAQELDFGIVKDAAGDPIDISSGWVAKMDFLYTSPLGAASVTKTGTWSYGADGALKLALTQAQSTQIVAGQYNAAVYVSDDAFTTSGTHQGGFVQVQAP